MRSGAPMSQGALANGCEMQPAGRTKMAKPSGRAPDLTGLPMNTSVVFLDCPAYMDDRGSIRCGLPAEVEATYAMTSTDGPLESAKIRCPRGHHFNGPIEALGQANPAAPAPAPFGVRGQDAVSRRPAP